MSIASIFKSLAWLAVISITLKSCKSLEPSKPEEKYLSTPESFERHLSVINIPINFDLNNLEKKINSEIEGLLFQDAYDEENTSLQLKVWKKSPIEVIADGDRFNIRVPLKVWAKGGLSFNNFGINFSDTKETNFELDLKFRTQISVSDDWKLEMKTQRDGFEWVKKPVLNLGPVNLPLASMLEGVIESQQDIIAGQLDREAQPNLEIKSYVEEAWSLIQNPYQLSKEYDVWLKVTPVAALITPLSGQGKNAGLSLGIRAFTETFIGRRPDVQINSVLPEVQIEDTISPEFNIGLSGKITHDQISALLAQHVLNQTFTFNDGKYKVTVTAIDLYGSGRNLVVEAGLKGSVNGVIYLSGRPAFDPVSETLYLEDLDFDLDTRDKLVKTASWLAHGRLVENFRKALSFPLGEQIEAAAEAIKSNIKEVELAPGITISGELNELEPSDVFITSEEVIATIMARGKADIKIKDFQY